MLLKSFRLFCLFSVVVLAGVTVSAQTTRPAVEYRSLLNMTFVETDGDFDVDGLHVIFPPPGYEQAMLTISTASGQEMATIPLRLDSYLNFPVFGRFVPESKAATIQLRRSGDYVLSVSLAGEVITRFPFSIYAEPNSDPYAKPKRFLRDGPWRDFGYFSLPPNNSNAGLRFNWWMSLRELPPGSSDASISLHLFDEHKEIAKSRETLRLDSDDWQAFTTDLINLNPRARNNEQLTMTDLVARDATYLLIVEANGKPIKSYGVEVNNRRLQRVDQSRIDFEPHADFIAPRFIESRADRSGNLVVTDAIWVKRSGVRGSFPAAGNRIASSENSSHTTPK